MNGIHYTIGVISILVENFICLYFLSKRFTSKYATILPQLVTFALIVFCGILVIESSTIYTIIFLALMFTYLIIFRTGTVVQKIIGILILFILMTGTSIIGAGIVSLLASTTIEHTLIYFDTTRSITLIFIKALQVVVFYLLAKKHEKSRKIQKRPALILGAIIIANFIYLLMIRAYAESPDLSPSQNHILVWLSVGALIIMIAVFLIYELFIREETKNIDLAMKLQRHELESGFQEEINSIYSYMRTWQHDYGNNLCALRVLMENGEAGKALEFIDEISNKQTQDQLLLKTGNLVLDAIVSSKLWLAKSKDIDVNLNAVYPSNNHISDNDLCAIISNLLDNSIEACDRINDITVKKHIELTFMPKGKSLFITIINSYNNELRLKGNRYFSLKKDAHHGIGISRIDSIVHKYHGYVERTHDNGIFETRIMLPLEPLQGG